MDVGRATRLWSHFASSAVIHGTERKRPSPIKRRDRLLMNNVARERPDMAAWSQSGLYSASAREVRTGSGVRFTNVKLCQKASETSKGLFWNVVPEPWELAERTRAMNVEMTVVRLGFADESAVRYF